MVTLFGKKLSRSDIARHVGDLSQAAGVRMMELRDGAETGGRIADVRTGSGLRFQVSFDRGMDLSVADYKGIPLAWRSPCGDVHPRSYEPRGTGWLKTFSGGLMTGCGLAQAGAPCVDDGEELGLHGRLSHIPAFDVKTETKWEDERCTFRVEGFVRENVPIRTNLVLQRVVEAELGSSLINLYDRVVNEAPKRSPLMMLYHINLGWPMLDQTARLFLLADSTEPRDDEARRGKDEYGVFSAPVAGYKEHVFYHELRSNTAGYSSALLRNEKRGLGVFVRFRRKELPRFIEWKMLGEGMYVLGLEPANCLTKGRRAERARGTLKYLEAGEQAEFHVQIGVLDGDDEINAFMKEENLS